MTDQRLAAYLTLAAERPHPFYARQLLRFAHEAGDQAAIALALSLGALSWRPEAGVRAWTEEAEPVRREIIQLRLFEEAA